MKQNVHLVIKLCIPQTLHIFLPLQGSGFLYNPFLQETSHWKSVKSIAKPESKHRV